MYYITININIVRYYISERYDGEYLDVDTGGMLWIRNLPGLHWKLLASQESQLKPVWKKEDVYVIHIILYWLLQILYIFDKS